MSLVEQMSPNAPLIFGKLFNGAEGGFTFVPPDLRENEPRIYAVAKKATSDAFLSKTWAASKSVPNAEERMHILLLGAVFWRCDAGVPSGTTSSRN